MQRIRLPSLTLLFYISWRANFEDLIYAILPRRHNLVRFDTRAVVTAALFLYVAFAASRAPTIDTVDHSSCSNHHLKERPSMMLG